MKHLFLPSLAALSVAALIGCSHGGAYEARNAQRYDLENKAPFALMDAQVQRSVTSSGIQKQTLEDGRLRVVANVRNREARRIQVQISCVFKDEMRQVTAPKWLNCSAGLVLAIVCMFCLPFSQGAKSNALPLHAPLSCAPNFWSRVMVTPG